MNFISVCKNVIASNNKKGWKDPNPSLRVSRTPCGKVVKRAHQVGIVDENGKIVARLISTIDGRQVISCGAKVALVTDYDVVDLSEDYIIEQNSCETGENCNESTT